MESSSMSKHRGIHKDRMGTLNTGTCQLVVPSGLPAILRLLAWGRELVALKLAWPELPPRSGSSFRYASTIATVLFGSYFRGCHVCGDTTVALRGEKMGDWGTS